MPRIALSISWSFVLGLILLTLIGCSKAEPTPIPAAASAPTAKPAPAVASVPNPSAQSWWAAGERPRAVQLPADEGAHGAPIEWWYFNGHLTDGRNDYSYHFVAFQTLTSTALTPQLLQLSWADHGRSLHLTQERSSFQAVAPAPGGFNLEVSGWRMRGDGTSYWLVFDAGAYSVELRATSLKPAAFHDKFGLVSMGAAGESYYYSRTRLETVGTLTVDGIRLAVSGIAWMDHQWGDFSPVKVGWDWASLQFNDGSELMLSLVWDPTDRRPFISYGTYIAPDAAVKHLDGSGITLTPTGSWKSPATGALYPMGWRLKIAPLGLLVTLTPVQENAEFASSGYVPWAYWEGAVSVTGQKNGLPVGGRGFVELVGYDPRQAHPEPRTTP